MVCSLAVLCLAMLSARGGEPAEGVTHALLINGGSKPGANYQSHLHHLEDMVELLTGRGIPRRRIHIFSADGEDEAPDLSVRELSPPGFWLIEGTALGRRLRPRTEITDTRWKEVTLQPARKDALQGWFETAHKKLAPGDRLLLFVTDHGTTNPDDPDNGAISLWQEKLTVEELKGMLALLRPGVRTVMVMSQCYSGTFANAMYDGASSSELEGDIWPSGDVCGFFSTTRDLRAYGCYPEGRDRDRIGHAFRYIDALDRHTTTAEAHLEVLVTDNTPDVPLRTTDIYLERIIADEAETRGMQVEVLVDSLLSEAWRDRAAWEAEIRLLDSIGDAFGIFSPRSLAELETYASELESLLERMKTYAERWTATAVSVQQENVMGFVSERSDWKPRLLDEPLRALNAESRKALLAELLPQLEEYTRGQPEIWQRLERMQNLSQRASEARWRLDIRRAALLRMRSILVRIGGQVLLARDVEAVDGQARGSLQRQAFERLATCEALAPGKLPAAKLAAKPPPIEPLPSLADEMQVLEEVLPSWLGVHYGRLPASARAARGLAPGATLLRAVHPDSPALEAGLEAGDIVLGPPERPFHAYGQLREWTMTSPSGTPLKLVVIRPGMRIEEDQEMEITLSLRRFPLEIPELPGPPQVGEVAPAVPVGLQPVGSGTLPELSGRSHLLFFWATWCGPCKRAVPEVMAFAAANGILVLAISDEDAGTVGGFLKQRQEAFFDQVAVDPLRRSFITYGVSGTPTIILVDGEGVVRHRQVGYNTAKGLTLDGWSWSGS